MQCYNLETLLNYEELDVVNCIGIDHMSVRVMQRKRAENLERNGEVKIIPTWDEFADYGQCIREYLYENNLVIPRGMSAGRYLREKGCYFDFLEYRRDVARLNFDAWMAENDLTLQYA